MQEVVVQIRNGRKVFVNGTVSVNALNGIDLVIGSGEFTAVAGPSGSGKTTLFNLLGGLDEPTEGDVMIRGRSLAALDRAELARLRLHNVGFVFQSYNLIPVLTAWENVEYPLMLKREPEAARRETVGSLLEAVGLTAMKDRRPYEMSGGEQQRVAIARSLVCNPALVLADEPTANLDSENAAALMEMMRSLNQDRGMTFVFSTHDPKVMAAATRLIKIRDGRIESDVRRVG